MVWSVVTYISDDGSKMSWVDHILSSSAMDKLITKVKTANDIIVSICCSYSRMISHAFSNSTLNTV